MAGARESEHTASLVLIGAVGGVLSGLFAIGGGILMVPLLVWRAGMDQRRAAATSLVAIIPTAVVSSTAYLLHGDVDVAAAAFVAIGAVTGAVLGSKLLTLLPVAWLRWMFIVFILAVAFRLLLVAPGRGHAIPLTPLGALGYIALGLGMGIASGLFGIGGGIIAVPVLVSVFGVGDLIAKGTALLVSIPTSIAGTTSNRRRGLIGSVDVRTGLIVGAAASVASLRPCTSPSPSPQPCRGCCARCCSSPWPRSSSSRPYAQRPTSPTDCDTRRRPGPSTAVKPVAEDERPRYAVEARKRSAGQVIKVVP